MAILLCVLMFTGSLTAQTEIISTPSGSGSYQDPYIITSVENLNWIADQVNNQSNDFSGMYFSQTQDINASETMLSTYNSGHGFKPIGNSTTQFAGIYYGNGHTIEYLYISRSNTSCVGLFGYTSGVQIINLGLIGVNIIGKNYVGGLVGQSCNYSGIIYCYSSGIVSGSDKVGGLVGYCDTPIIQNCYSIANVSGSDTVGGLIGGLVGNFPYGMVNYSYSSGSVNGSTNVGGLVGYQYGDYVTHYSFWDTETSGQTISAGGTGETTAKMKSYLTYYNAGWDLMDETTNGTNDYWGIDETGSDNNGYPFLQWQGYSNNAAPVVKTKSVTNIAFTTATGNETVKANASNITQYGVCWNTTGSPTIADNKTEEGSLSSTGSYTSDITGLERGTTYYLRAYAVNAVGTSYGDTVSFTTLPFNGGSGTLNDPYLISTLDALKCLSEHSSFWSSGIYFKQTADIDAASTADWNSGKGFLQIGNTTTKFCGNYNGSGHTIDSLFISRSSEDNIGFFGYVSGAVIDSIGIINVDITGGNDVGSFAGYNYNSTIENCYSTGSINTNGDYGGGLVGYNNGSDIQNCYSTGSVNASGNNVGGLVGYNYNNSTIENCYSAGSVSGSSNVGGLVGDTSSSTVTNSFWDTETSGQTTSAGGTGKTTAEMKSYLTYYNAGWDLMDETANGTNDYWGIDETGSDNNGYPFLQWQGYSNNAAPVVTTQSVTNIAFTTATGNETVEANASNITQYGVCWDTTGSPTIADNKTEEGSLSSTGSYTSDITGLERETTYYLRAYAVNAVGTSYGDTVSFSTIPFGGTGTSNDPYLISTLDALKYISEHSSIWSSGIYFKQTADIDASSTADWNSGKGFSPIGNNTTKFKGNYNGNGHTIDSLFISRSSKSYIGLFGYVSGAVIDSIGIINVNITGSNYVGGLVGENYDSNIENCCSTGSISGSEYVGGLAGYNYNNSTIENCYSSGSINASGSYVGGLVGYNLKNSTIENCYSSGSINASGSYVGGLVGYNLNNSTIENCYSRGSINASGNHVGGLVGGKGTSTVINSFWDTQTSGQTSSAGGTGKTSDELQSYSTYDSAGWDLMGENTNGTNDYWGMDETGNKNNGYPFLQWQGYSNNLEQIVTTQAVTNIELTTATGNGTVEVNSNITQYGVCWNTTGSPTIVDNKTEEGSFSSTGSYTSNITGLIRGTNYYVRAYVATATDTSYGHQVSFTTIPFGGSGTSNDPYLISTLSDLEYLSEHSSYWSSGIYFKQTADIDASSTADWNAGKGFSPIGNDTTKFCGNYNGNGHTIDSLFISRSSQSYIGFFGYVSGAVIDSIGIINLNITGYSGVGGLVGDIYHNSTIENCYSSGSINASDSYVGGLAGTSDSSDVQNCYSTGSVSGSIDGGLIGENYFTDVKNCYSTGSVSGSSNVGGLVGDNYGSTVTHSFWDVTTSGKGSDGSTSGSAGGTGESTANMKTASTFLSAGWDTSIWYMDSGVNNGYPYLSWQNTGGTPMPVELTTFTATASGSTVNLKWQTATEVNNYGFQVQRKKTKVKSEWQKIGFVKGNGNSNSIKSYSFIDTNPLSGKVKYRLKQIDNDGKFVYSKTVEVTTLPTQFKLSQNYPNPFNPTTVINYSIPKAENVTLKVFDLLGKEVATLVNEQKSPGNYKVKFDAGNLASGTYIYRLKAGDFTSVKKLMFIK